MSISECGKLIEKYRLEKGISIKSLSEKSGVGYATLYDIIKGKRQNMSIENLKKVSELLEIPTNELLGYEVIEHEVSSLEDTFNIILESDTLTIDNVELTESEKLKVKQMLENIIYELRVLRNNNK